MKRIPLILTALILATACTKDIEYNGTDCGTIMIANSMNRVGDNSYVRMTRSRYFLDPSGIDYTIDDATVSMTVNGQRHTLAFDNENSRYTSDCIITPGSILSINASHPEFGTVRAVDTVPMNITCSVDTFYRAFRMKGVKIDTIYYHGLDVGSVDSVCTFDICLVSDTCTNEYFMLEFNPYRVLYMLHGDTLDTIHQELSYRLPTKSLIAMEKLDQERLGDFAGLMDLTPVINRGARSYTFTDRHLSDTTHLEFEVLMEPIDTSKTYLKSEAQAKFAIRSLSWAAYTYQKSVRKFRSHKGPMSEPITMWTNIEGDGTGILGSYVEFSDSLTLKGF